MKGARVGGAPQGRVITAPFSAGRGPGTLHLASARRGRTSGTVMAKPGTRPVGPGSSGTRARVEDAAYASVARCGTHVCTWAEDP